MSKKLGDKDEKTPRIMVSLSGEQNDYTQVMAKARGISRSGFMRELITRDMISSKYSVTVKYKDLKGRSDAFFKNIDSFVKWCNKNNRKTILDLKFLRVD